MRILSLIFIVVLLLAPAAQADSDQDRARRAVQSGAVRPLGEILSVVQRRYPGRVLDAGLGERGGNYFYDIRLLNAGRVTELRVDAGSAEVLGVRGDNTRPEPRRAEGPGLFGGVPGLGTGFDGGDRGGRRSVPQADSEGRWGRWGEESSRQRDRRWNDDNDRPVDRGWGDDRRRRSGARD